MMSRVRTLRVNDLDWERWRVASDGITTGAWIRRTCNEECDRLEAERREAEHQQDERRKLKDAAHGYY